MKIQNVINPTQKLWIDLWEELLHPSTIDHYALQPINCRTLIDDILSMEHADIKEDRKKSIVENAINELLNSNYGIRKDVIIKSTEFKRSILSEPPPKFDKAELPIFFEYVKKLRKSLTKDDIYFKTLLSNVYKEISFNGIPEDVNSLFEKAYNLENMLKSLLIELIERGFSYKYLKSRLSIFHQIDHFHRGNVQFKIYSLFRKFIEEPQKYLIIIPLHDLQYLPQSLVIQHIEITPTVPNYIINIVRDQILLSETYVNSFFSHTECSLLRQTVLKIDDVLDRRRTHEEFFEIFKNIDSTDFKTLFPLLEYFKMLAEDIYLLFHSNKENPSDSLNLNNLFYRVPKSVRQLVSRVDTDFALSSNENIKNLCEAISKKKSINILRAYFYRLLRIQKEEQELSILNNVKKLLQKRSKIQFGIIENVRALDPFCALKHGFEDLNCILSYLQFQYGHIKGNILKDCIVINNTTETIPKVMLIDHESLKRQNQIIKKSFTKPEKLSQKIRLLQGEDNFFENILRWYGLSMQKGDEISQFLTLWVALESLIMKDSDKSEGPYIAQIGSSILGLYFVRKTIRNLWADMCRLSIQDKVIEKFRIALDQDGINEADFLFTIITQGKDLIKLIEQHNNLLSYRIYNCCNMFSTVKSLRQEIKSYTKQISWNLFRHYQLRNRIIHNGYRAENTIAFYYTQLNYYFGIIFDNIIHLCLHNKNISISKNIAKFKTLFDLYLETIENSPNWEHSSLTREYLHRVIIDPIGEI